MRLAYSMQAFIYNNFHRNPVELKPVEHFCYPCFAVLLEKKNCNTKNQKLTEMSSIKNKTT